MGPVSFRIADLVLLRGADFLSVFVRRRVAEKLPVNVDFATVRLGHIALAPGEHVVRVTLGGKEWIRTVQITGGEIQLRAEVP